jgi:ubiquitin-protein ligase E3 C
LEELARFVNVAHLSEAIIHTAASTALFTVQAELRLWLLAHFINLHRLNRGVSQEPGYMRAISILLSSSASEIVDRIDIEDLEGLQQAGEEDDEGHPFPLPLPRFVKNELITLVDKQSITGLLAKFNK